jgi:gamma-glutamyltranspeptidase/glutathione hydrolase
MVVSVSRPATDVGVDVLRRGGNAVDAAVAVAFALAATYPEAGNIGGGGFMLVWPPSPPAPSPQSPASNPQPPAPSPVCIEYRETAPAAATRTMFRPGEGTYTHRAVGVPGTVRGLAVAHERYGKLPWKELVLPAVRLAREGFVLDRAVAASLNRVLHDSPDKAELRRVFGKATPWQPGDRLVQPELADTLSKIAAGGADAFYTGPIAERIVAEMRAGGGLITADDLAKYRANVRRPIHTTYRGYDIYGPPPPSSGGICLAQMLNTLERFDLANRCTQRHTDRSLQGRWSADTLHVLVETMRRAYCDRARHLGDPDFIKIPDHLTTKDYAARLAASIDLRRATPSDKLAPDITLAPENDHTTHFSIVDPAGMAVANTYTLEDRYGSRVVVRGGGFLLNNEMGDFNWRPGVTNRRGAIGTEPNTIAPGKRMLSSMTPVIVARNGKPVLITGSPGGRTIINTALQVVINMIDYDMPLAEAVAAPRLHHGWFPDEIRFEETGNPKYAAVVEELKRRGHRFSRQPEHREMGRQMGHQGDAHSIRVYRDHLEGAADARISGHAAGF